MAFTDVEKYKIVRLLGWPANVLVPTSLSFSNIVANRLLCLPAPAEDDARTMLTRIAELDGDLETALAASGVRKLDDIEFFGQRDGTKLEELRNERRRILLELASLLDIAFGPGLRGGGMMGNIRL